MSQFYFRKKILCFLLTLVLIPSLAQQTSLKKAFDQVLGVENKNEEEMFNQLSELSKKTHPTDSLFIRVVLKMSELGSVLSSPEKDSTVHFLIQKAIQLPHLVCTEQERGSLFYWVGFYEESYGLDFEKGIEFLEKSKKIRTRLSGEHTIEVANCYYLLGDIYKYRTFDFFQAEKSYEKALEIMEKLPVKDDRQLARTYYSLATTNRSQKDYVKALSFGFNTLELVNKTGNSVFLERIYVTIANIYRDMLQFKEAKSFYQKAMTLNATNNKGNLYNEVMAVECLNLAETFAMEGNLQEAIKNFELAERYYSRSQITDQLNYIFLFQQMGLAYSRANHSKALPTFLRALTELERIGIRKGNVCAGVFMNIGSHYFRIAQYDSSLLYYEKAIRAFSQGGGSNNNYRLYVAYIGKASNLKKLGKTNADKKNTSVVLDYYTQAERLLNANRDALDIEKSKLDFFDRPGEGLVNESINIYEEILSFLYEHRNDPIDSLNDRILYFLDQSKMKSTHDALREAERFSVNLAGDSLLRKLRDYRSSFFDIQDRLNQELSKNSPNEKRVKYLQSKIVEVDRSVQAFKNEIRQQYPAFYSSNYSNTYYKTHEVQEFCTNRESAFIEYFWGDENVYGLGINKEKTFFIKLGSKDSIESYLRKFLNHFTRTEYGNEEKRFESYKQNGFDLYELLVQPFSDLLKERIHIIPDGLISQLPFESLLTHRVTGRGVDYKNLPYVLNKHIVSYSFSSALLLKEFARSSSRSNLLAFGYTNGQQYRSGQSPLPLSVKEPELEVISSLFSRGRFLCGDEATEGNFKQLAPESDVLHLAVHGAGDPLQDYSAKLYFKALADSSEDGVLHSYELYQLRLKASLAMLTACESGIGKNYRGEGMMSMANSFINAGCSNVALTLWKLNDKVSTKLMQVFYQDVINGVRLDEALIHAKRNYLKESDEYTADPRLWAALVMYSNGDMLMETSTDWLNYLWPVLAISFLAIVYLIYRRRRLITHT